MGSMVDVSFVGGVGAVGGFSFGADLLCRWGWRRGADICDLFGDGGRTRWRDFFVAGRGGATSSSSGAAYFVGDGGPLTWAWGKGRFISRSAAAAKTQAAIASSSAMARRRGFFVLRCGIGRYRMRLLHWRRGERAGVVVGMGAGAASSMAAAWGVGPQAARASSYLSLDNIHRYTLRLTLSRGILCVIKILDPTYKLCVEIY